MIRKMLFIMVTVMGLAGGAVVTTPASAQTAPLQCEWPVTGNLLTDGMFTSGNSALWGANNPYTPTSKVATISGHPCGYTSAVNSGQLDAIVNHNQGNDVLFSGWVRKTEPNSLPEFSLRPVAYTAGVGYYDYGTTVNSPSPAIGEWGFVQVCVPGDYDNELYHLFIYQFTVSNTYWTGLSVVPWQCEPAVTATTTGEPTAVLTSTPTATATPAITPTATVALTATATIAVVVLTMTPFPTATPLPAPTATPTETIPQFYADLPSLPETIPLGTEDIAPFDFPEITVADGQDIIRTPMSLIGYVADTNWWPIIRYTMHLMVAMAMLFRIGGFTL